MVLAWEYYREGGDLLTALAPKRGERLVFQVILHTICRSTYVRHYFKTVSTTFSYPHINLNIQIPTNLNESLFTLLHISYYEGQGLLLLCNSPC